MLVALTLSLPWVVAALADAPDGAAMVNAVAELILPLSVAYLVSLPLVADLGLPRVGVDWDPTGYGPGSWVLLVVAAAWYAAVFALPRFALAVVLALPS